ncbi:uncharacterized protein [Diabrotica undecimpunctata]|uniref:uncharacterized protein n=1 Tax=Diabrotica undecimpunctata TaxID=50387 RepID=UPI003B63CCA6
MVKALQMDIVKVVSANKKSTFYKSPKICSHPPIVGKSSARSSVTKVSVGKRSSSRRDSSKCSSRSVQNVLERIHSQRNLTWHEIMGSYILADLGLQFEINFDNELWACFKSVELLETMKFMLPENVRLIAIKKEKTQINVNAVTLMINNYNSILYKLTNAQMHLLKEKMREIELNIQPGLMRIKWSSLGITEFANANLILINNLKTLVLQVKHVENDLLKRIKQLTKMNLFDFDQLHYLKLRVKTPPCNKIGLTKGCLASTTEISPVFKGDLAARANLRHTGPLVRIGRDFALADLQEGRKTNRIGAEGYSDAGPVKSQRL